MANLNDFLGGLVSSISNARVNSDLQSVQIAQEYAKNNLLQHFAVPRMRIDKVELTVPVAIDEYTAPRLASTVYEPINKTSFASVTYKSILKTVAMDSLPLESSKDLKSFITEQVHIVETKLNVHSPKELIATYSSEVSDRLLKNAATIYKAAKRTALTKEEQLRLQKVLQEELRVKLAEEFKIKEEVGPLHALNVIVEAAKLREIKQENIIMIKMTVSEQGMEWVKMENDNGETVAKLMPE